LTEARSNRVDVVLDPARIGIEKVAHHSDTETLPLARRLRRATAIARDCSCRHTLTDTCRQCRIFHFHHPTTWSALSTSAPRCARTLRHSRLCLANRGLQRPRHMLCCARSVQATLRSQNRSSRDVRPSASLTDVHHICNECAVHLSSGQLPKTLARQHARVHPRWALSILRTTASTSAICTLPNVVAYTSERELL
jgi:hypothetical protein